MLSGVPVKKLNKICAECRPGAAFGTYWLLTERLRYETTSLPPALLDHVRAHGQCDVAYGDDIFCLNLENIEDSNPF